ncbi:DegV family protein [Clostridium tarantellae]|uniref:DegV family EDD domain-containing protein n=1 Tax=Clostridium tarantellae TaxID=39493 RepID=A0A6I1MPA1_9CLOT|nr:DegV family protein [Clostridium tarantellae]MPQ45255.1 DegV family EDD domain-containing protein [Clostridium tarantellae]
MQKIALITDSTCGLPQKYIQKYNVKTLNLSIIYKDKEYIDGIDITAEKVYEKLKEEIPTTSMPSIESANILVEKLIEDGYTHAICLPISSGLSGTINTFRLCASQYEDKIQCFVFDTKILSLGVGMLVIETGKMIEEGKSFQYICEQVPILRSKMSMYFTVDTLEYLIKGGRIGRVSGVLGELLSLKPIITMGEDGRYITHSKVRGSKQAINKLLKLGNEFLENGKCKIAIVTGTMHEEAKKLKQVFKEHPNTTFLEIGILTPVLGIHSGPQLIGLVVMKE